jgi:N-formylglutamate deformylase
VNPVEVSEGDGPVILAMPHTGTWMPDDLRARLNERGRLLADTDWHVDRLYDGLLAEATTVRATFHRYVIDANRDPSGVSLYADQNTTALCPLTDFDGFHIWREGEGPSSLEVSERAAAFHAPYHAELERQIARLHERHGVVVLYDCHSIRSEIPFLFDGILPDFNIGTFDEQSCAPAVATAAFDVCHAAAADGHTTVLNGRFKGGWTTRHYGAPDRHIHAIQMELAQSTYPESEAPPFAFAPAKAATLRPHLAEILARLERFALEHTV